MIRRLRALYGRYEAAHLRLGGRGTEIRDSSGETVGYVDQLVLEAGRLRVTGWALAARVRLVLAGLEAEAAPVLRRPDVATALGHPETVGFDLSLPARLDDLRRAEAPGLILTEEQGHPAIPPLSLSVPLPGRARLRTLAGFGRDLVLAAPAVVGWRLTRDPKYRARVKARLRLATPRTTGPLEPGLFLARPLPAITPQRITIVLPVYNAFDLLKDCLVRVEAHTDLPWRMVMIEDGSTDERVLPFLRDWAATRDQVTLLENPQNMGFIASVNRGLAQAMAETAPEDGPDEGPIVLLNSDALVPAGWASRLIRPFQSHDNIASVTPMSNDAEIFSAPVICARQMLEPGQGDAIDAVAQGFEPEALLSVAPTGVGFCMAMGRDWLARVPELDTSFGRGYGEEVDWCQKVAQLGGRHLGLPGLFVEHRGGESFGSDEKRALVAKNNQIVSHRYPEYDREVQDFIAADPMRTARLALGLAWAGSLSEAPVPVYLAHALGGGAEHALQHRIAGDLQDGRPAVILRVGGARRYQLELISAQGLTLGQSDEASTIARLLAVLPRRHLVYSCGVGDPDPVTLPDLLLDLMAEGDSAEMLFHDYFPLSPAYTLLDSKGRYHGAPLPPQDDPAFRLRRPDGTEVTLQDWQAAWAGFAARAELVVFSQASADILGAVWPDLATRIVIRPHALRHDIPRLIPPLDGKPVLGVLGNIGLQKGAGVVVDLATRLERSGAGSLVLVGNIDPAYALPAQAQLHGSYAVEDLPGLAARYGISHWLIPSIWPETFCYTVHEALATGLPVLAFGIGAQGDAVRAAPNGIEMDFDLEADLAQRVLDALSLTAAKGGAHDVKDVT